MAPIRSPLKPLGLLNIQSRLVPVVPVVLSTTTSAWLGMIRRSLSTGVPHSPPPVVAMGARTAVLVVAVVLAAAVAVCPLPLVVRVLRVKATMVAQALEATALALAVAARAEPVQEAPAATRVSLVLVALVEPTIMRMGQQAVSGSESSLVGAAVAVPHSEMVLLVVLVAVVLAVPVLVALTPLPVPLTAAAAEEAVEGQAAAVMPVLAVVLAL